MVPRKEDYANIVEFMKPGMTAAGKNTYQPKRYQSIPMLKPIRFRNFYDRLRIFLSWIPELLRLQDPLHQHHKSSVYITEQDITLCKNLFEFSKHTIQFVNYFEDEKHYQVGKSSKDRSKIDPESGFLAKQINKKIFKMMDVMNSYIHGFKYACAIKPTHSLEEKQIRLSYMDTLTEQLFGHRMIRKDGRYQWEKTGVPIRITKMHKAAMYFNYKDRNLNLSSIQKSLSTCAKVNKTTSIYEKCYMLQKKIRELTETWTHEVQEFLINQVMIKDHGSIADRSFSNLDIFTNHNSRIRLPIKKRTRQTFRPNCP